MALEIDEDALNLFQEPEDFYEPEKEPTFATHKLLSGEEIKLRLVGHNPLWGHLLWNAGRNISDYIEQNAGRLVKGKTVLELGAGAALPSIVCSIMGASTVVVSDYPDADLVENMDYNVRTCNLLSSPRTIYAEGYLWGAPTEKLTAHLPEQERSLGFDVLILADVIFNHSEHRKLIESVQRTLKRSADAVALVFFTPYRTWKYHMDLAFFDMAREEGFAVEKVFEKVMEKHIFENDRGDELLRRTVFGYEMRWANLD